MLAEESDANTVAIQVGYESVAQFNREYRRLFGSTLRACGGSKRFKVL